MNKKWTIGQKIKRLRKRNKISQQKLLECLNSDSEAKGDTAWISRIEHGKISPGKDTIFKIIETFNLKVVKMFSLLNLNTGKLKKFLNTTKTFSYNQNIDEICQNSVNEIAYELDLLSAVIFLVDENDDNKVYSVTFTKTWFTEQLHKALPRAFGDHFIYLDQHGDNIISQTISEKRSIHTTNLREVSIHAYSSELSKTVAKITGFKSGITLPLLDNDKSIGAMFYIKDHVDDFETERPVLSSFTEHIAAAIINARKYESLKKEIVRLKNEQ